MLKRVLDIVGTEDWFDTAQPFEKTILLTHGAAHCVTLSRAGRPELFVKFSELTSLATEAQRCRRASGDFAGVAPGFVGYLARAGLDVLATKAESFGHVTAELLGQRGARVRVLNGLERYFTLMRAAAPQAAAAPGPAHGFDDLAAYFATANGTPCTAAAIELLRHAMPQLPAMPQHGDLVTNNLGLRPDGSLVVFDWEDYGALTLPGLDLFTLETSLRAPAAARGAGGGMSAQAVERCCAALELAPDAYRRLAPAYALAFRYLKRNYSPEIRARIDALLEQVSGGPAGPAAR